MKDLIFIGLVMLALVIGLQVSGWLGAFIFASTWSYAVYTDSEFSRKKCSYTIYNKQTKKFQTKNIHL